eukprot:6188060-Pleurochrysis_carterae.AAC.4
MQPAMAYSGYVACWAGGSRNQLLITVVAALALSGMGVVTENRFVHFITPIGQIAIETCTDYRWEG